MERARSDTATSRRLPRIDFFRSIRFRLTAWYTLALIIIIALLGLLLSTFMARALEDEVDQRLWNASEFVGDLLGLSEDTTRRYVVQGSNDWVQQIQNNTNDDLDSMLSSGLFVIAIDLVNYDINEEGNAPEGLLNSIHLTGDTPDGALQTGEIDEQQIRVLVRHVYVQSADGDELDAPPVGIVLIGESLQRQEKILQLFNQLLRAVSAGGVLLATWGGWLLAGRALAPVNRITSTADEIARQGDAQESLSTRLEVNDTGDELARLAITFNAMLDRIERAFRGQRRFVADASHELRTPLTAIRGNVDVLERRARSGNDIDPEMLKESLGDMKRESARMARLIDDLLLLARTDAEGLGHMIHPEPVSLEVVAREALRTAEAVATGQRLHLTIRQPLLIYGDGDRLVQVMIILLDNAIRHTPPRGTIDLVIDAAEPDDGQQTSARIQVVDSGEGIPAEHLSHLFERFYRIEGSRSRLAGGSGLGLAIALAIVRGHNGWIDVESEEGKGTHVTVWLPILESPVAKQEGIPVLPHFQESPHA
ncbi:MAG TPA: ATP-binding protein [Thermomicrobiales bacterium]|nr:ATP-binding protein [Thermomicrobiales bacterium]